MGFFRTTRRKPTVVNPILEANSHKRVKEISRDEILGAVKSMNDKTSIHPNGISNKMLKHSGLGLINYLLILFNKSLKGAQVPCNWKHSYIE